MTRFTRCESSPAAGVVPKGLLKAGASSSPFHLPLHFPPFKHHHHHHLRGYFGSMSTRTATANDTQPWSASVVVSAPLIVPLSPSPPTPILSFRVCLSNHRCDFLPSPRPTTSTSSHTIRHVQKTSTHRHHHLTTSTSISTTHPPPPRPSPQVNLRHSTTPPPHPHFLPPLSRRHLVSFSLLPLPPTSPSHLLFLLLSQKVDRQ